MQKAISCFLLVLFSFAYSYEALKYFSKSLGDNSISWVDDSDSEEGKTESEKSKEKNEKFNFSEDFYLNHLCYNNTLIYNLSYLAILNSQQNPNFSSADYSQKVYSPPELV
jgi:hypothetical protein